MTNILFFLQTSDNSANSKLFVPVGLESLKLKVDFGICIFAMMNYA